MPAMVELVGQWNVEDEARRAFSSLEARKAR